jgi:hypothetical protein
VQSGANSSFADLTQTEAIKEANLFASTLMSTAVIRGLTPSGQLALLKVSEDGTLQTSASGGAGSADAVISETALTAPGSTTARSMLGYNQLTYQVDVSGIGTSVVVRVEGNLLGGTYVNLSTANTDTTITANGSYLFTFDGKLGNTRFTVVAINGGTPSITAHVLRGN